MVSYNRQLRINIRRLLGLAQALVIPSGFGRSRIRRNCGYTLLANVFHYPAIKSNFKSDIFSSVILNEYL